MRATEEDDGDADPLTGTLAVTVTLSDFDEPPEIEGPASVADYPENSRTTTAVGSYTAADPERAGVTWSDLSGNDADKFELSNTGVLTFKASPNFEDQPGYEVTVNASDGMFPGSLDVTVTIADVNEPPMVDGTTAIDHAENEGTALANASYPRPIPRGPTSWLEPQGNDGGHFESARAACSASPRSGLRLQAPQRQHLRGDRAATEEDDGTPTR